MRSLAFCTLGALLVGLFPAIAQADHDRQRRSGFRVSVGFSSVSHSGTHFGAGFTHGRGPVVFHHPHVHHRPVHRKVVVHHPVTHYPRHHVVVSQPAVVHHRPIVVHQPQVVHCPTQVIVVQPVVQPRPRYYYNYEPPAPAAGFYQRESHFYYGR